MIVLLTASIFNMDTDDSLVEPTHQSPYNARALNEDETRAAIGKGSKARHLCPVLK